MSAKHENRVGNKVPFEYTYFSRLHGNGCGRAIRAPFYNMKLKHNELSMEMPEKWADHSSVTLVAPFDESGTATTIVITRNFVGGHQTLEEFVAYQLQILEGSMPEFTLLDSWENIINGRQCLQQLHHFQTENGVFQQVQTFFLANQMIYTVTGTSALKEFAKYTEVFRDAVLSFEIGEM